MNIKILPGSTRAMLTAIGIQLWQADRFDPEQLPLCRKALDDEKAVQGLMMRSSVADLEPALSSCLNGDTIIVEGQVTPRGLRLLKRLGVPVEVRLSEAEAQAAAAEPRYLDMTMLVVVLAALVMGTRYLALGMHDRMLYVMAGLGYALFFVVRSFSYQWRRPRSRG